MKIIATIEARMTSTRLPGKVLLPILGQPALAHMIRRVQHAKYIDSIIVATTRNQTDDPIATLCQDLQVGCYRGSEDNVLERVYLACKAEHIDYLCKLTGDCPLIDPLIIDRVITEHLNGDYDYSSTGIQECTFPIGFDTEVMSFKTLETTYQATTDPIDQTHVTCYIYHHPRYFKLHEVMAPAAIQGRHFRLTLDTPEDYQLICEIYAALFPTKPMFHAKDIVAYLRHHPESLLINQHVRQKSVDEG